VEEELEGWEVRTYPAQLWVATLGWDVYPHDGPEHQKAFFRLFEYIDGDNEAGQKIDMTAPVTLRVVAGEGPNCESNYTMAFYIPGQLQSGPPAPRNSAVWLEQRQDIRFAVRRFSGFPTELDWSREAAELFRLTEEAGRPARHSPLWTAGYDGPSVIVNRRNEVWLELPESL